MPAVTGIGRTALAQVPDRCEILTVSEPDPQLSALSGALEEIVARSERFVREIGLRHGLLAADVDEIFQEVRIKLWQARPDGEKISALPSSYVYKAALSAARDVLRRRRRSAERSYELDDLPEVHVTAHEDSAGAVERSELLAAVGREVERLAAPRRVAVRMHLSGYGREEIASIMGWSEAKTRNLLYRGLDDLRGRLRAAGITVEDAW
jgi:RNA polymerase sigma-70 factor (ECF subfamily)